jgi:Rrf2 family protein
LKFSTKTRYGIRTMIEIASDPSQNGVFQKDIAQKQGISVKYLDHIIPPLKAAGLIINAKGKKSGYCLMQDPSEITIYDIHSAYEPGICVVECLALIRPCPREKICKVKDFWQGLNKQVENYLKSVTLYDLISKKVMPEF